MKPSHACVAGVLIGLLFGSAICLIQNISMNEALFRIFILTAAGGWMGAMLAWLNQLLPSKSAHQSGHQSGHQSEHTDVR